MDQLMENNRFEKMTIQWFPGHMTKAQRMIEENLKLVDAVCEILDARIPRSSRNPDIDRLAGDKPRLVILNRIDLADPAVTARWKKYFEAQGLAILETDARTGKGVNGFAPAVRRLLAGKIREYEAKGQVGRPLRMMILGIPNVGKSTFINKVAGRKAAIAGDKPGVTRGKQWINIDAGLDLLDTPGPSSTARRWGRCWPSPTPSKPTCWTRRPLRQTSCSVCGRCTPRPSKTGINLTRTRT